MVRVLAKVLLVSLIFLQGIGDEAFAGGRRITEKDLLEITDIGGLFGAISLSPDQTRVAFQLQKPNLEKNSYDIGWYMMSVAGREAPHFVGAGGEVMLARVYASLMVGSRRDIKAKWSPDSKWVAYPLKRNGKIELWRSSVEGVQERLTDIEDDIASFSWSDDGRRIEFSTVVQKDVVSLTREEEGKSGYYFDDRFLVQLGTQPLTPDCAPSSASRVPQIEDACRNIAWTVDVQTKRVRPVERASPQSETALPSVNILTAPARTGLKRNLENRAAWFQNIDEKKFAGFMPPRVLVVSSPERQCTHEACRGVRLEDLWWSQDGREVVFQKREGVSGSRAALYAWNPVTDRIRRIVSTDDKISSCELARDSLICLREKWTAPNHIVSLRLKDGALATIFDPNPQYSDFDKPHIEKLELRDAFNNEAIVHVVYPLDYQKGRRYPAVIVQYRSRGFLRGGVGDEYPIPVLSANGFVVLSLDRPDDMRLSSEVSDADEFSRAQTAEFYGRKIALNAIETALDVVDKRGIVDPARVGITGLSNGEETLAYSLIHSRRFAAAIASGSYWNPSVYLLAPNYLRDGMRRDLGNPRESLEKWREVALSLNARNITTPLLIQVSSDELTVATENYVALKDAGKAVEMYVFPGGHHNKWLPSHRYAVYRRGVQWLGYWLQNREVSDPVNPEQYTRWRKLREQRDANHTTEKPTD